jgi:hypothetical protein
LYETQLLDTPAAGVLAAALRASASVTSLSLMQVGLWREPAAAAVLLAGLTAHPSVQTLDLSNNGADSDSDGDEARLDDGFAAAAALGALVAANAPALHTLTLDNCLLRDSALGPLVQALPRNTHLRELHILDNCITADFARRQLQPALRTRPLLHVEYNIMRG